jgi:hypothetical protein
MVQPLQMNLERSAQRSIVIDDEYPHEVFPRCSAILWLDVEGLVPVLKQGTFQASTHTVTYWPEIRYALWAARRQTGT